MSAGFQLITANELNNSMLLASMHNLRCRVFYQELKWTAGLNVIRDMEFDQYDQSDTWYIVHTDATGEVDACCRLMPTSRPYMIAEHYPEFIEHVPLPHSDEVWEISRWCASEEIRKDSKGKITGQLIAAAIEFGLAAGIKNYVALATDTVIPVIKRFGGWDPTPLGERRKTPDDHSYSVIYTVSEEMLESVRKKNGINDYLLFNIVKSRNPSKEGKMEPQINVTSVPQQIRHDTEHQLMEMEKTLSYLEAMAFARNYQPITAGLRFTRMILQCDKDATGQLQVCKNEALKALDKAYIALKQKLDEYDTKTREQTA